MYNNYLTSRMDNNESKEPAAPIFTCTLMTITVDSF